MTLTVFSLTQVVWKLLELRRTHTSKVAVIITLLSLVIISLLRILQIKVVVVTQEYVG